MALPDGAPVAAGLGRRPALLHRRPARRRRRAGRRTGPGRAAGARPPRLRRLLEPAGGDRAGPRRRLVPLRRRGADRGRRLGLRRRPGQGHDHLRRREHLPAEVEAAIAELPDVTAAAVVGRAGPTWGEVGCAYVVLRPGADLDEIALRAHLEQRLARYKIPRYVELCDDLPRNATGKVLRSVLREQARHDHPSPTDQSPTTDHTTTHGGPMTTIAHPKDLLTMIGEDLGTQPLARRQPGADQPLRRRHRRPPVDPRRRRAGQGPAPSAGRSPTATSRCRC